MVPFSLIESETTDASLSVPTPGMKDLLLARGLRLGEVDRQHLWVLFSGLERCRMILWRPGSAWPGSGGLSCEVVMMGMGEVLRDLTDSVKLGNPWVQGVSRGR